MEKCVIFSAADTERISLKHFFFQCDKRILVFEQRYCSQKFRNYVEEVTSFAADLLQIVADSMLVTVYVKNRNGFLFENKKLEKKISANRIRNPFCGSCEETFGHCSLLWCFYRKFWCGKDSAGE